MNYFSPRSLLVGLAMVLAAGIAVAVRPSEKIADRAPPIDLESMIPARFAGWEIDASIAPVTVSPDVQAKLDKIYNQTLSRTYVNSRQERIMLSIAYGGDQSDNLQFHRPEICYTAQGFQVLKEAAGELVTRYGELSIRRLVAQQGLRHEPITYWITVGDRAVHVGLQQKLAQLKYGLTGAIPDGMLIRVSNISNDDVPSFVLHREFIDALLVSVDGGSRERFIGKRVSNG